LCCSQNDNDSKRYLEKKWLQAKYESKKIKLNILLYFWLPTWNHVEKSGNFYKKKLVKILAIENLKKKHLNFSALLIF